MRPMLADEIGAQPTQLDRAVQPFLSNPEWAVEQKVDGHRVLIEVVEGKVTAIGRDGQPKANEVPRRVLDEFRVFTTGTWVFDGELLGGVLYVFDMPLVDIPAAQVTPGNPLRVRRQVLEGFFDKWQPGPTVRLLEQFRDPEDKAAAYLRFREANVEGVMLKDLGAKYRIDGRRSRGVLKAKFVNSLDCFVTDLNMGGKENAELSVFDGNGDQVMIGRCSLLGKPAVAMWTVVEVRYLYATADHRLFQPRLLRTRTDKTPDECLVTQLKYTNKGIL